MDKEKYQSTISQCKSELMTKVADTYFNNQDRFLSISEVADIVGYPQPSTRRAKAKLIESYGFEFAVTGNDKNITHKLVGIGEPPVPKSESVDWAKFIKVFNEIFCEEAA